MKNGQHYKGWRFLKIHLLPMLSNTAIRKIFWGIAGFGTNPTKVIIECGLSDKPQASEKAKLVVLPQILSVLACSSVRST